MKRFITVLMSAMIALSMMPSMAFAAGDATVDTAVASIGSGEEILYYSSLAAAIDAASDNDVISLVKDVALLDTLTINKPGKTLTIDLNQKTLKGRVNLKGGTLNLRKGNVTGEQPLNVYGNSTNASNYSVLNIESTVTVNKEGDDLNSVCIFDANSSKVGYGAVANIAGTVYGTVFVSGNLGNVSSTYSDEMRDSNVVNVLEGGKIYTTADQGIAMNGAAVVNVERGSSVTGREAIGVKRGKLNVNGGTLTAVGPKVDPVAANNNGTEASGAAISVTSTYNYSGNIKVVVNDGTITSVNNDAFYVGRSIKDGNLIEFSENGYSIDVKGGAFSSNPKAYVADGTNIYRQMTGKYFVGSKPSNTSGYNDWEPKGGIFEEIYVAPTPTPEPEDPITNTGSGDNASTTVDASDNTTVSDAGKTETTIDSALGDKIVENVKDNNAADVVIKAETEKGDSTGSTVALPESTVQALAKDTEASVTIKTDSATVTLDKDAVKATAAQAGDSGEVKLVVETVENTEDTLKVELKLVTSKGTVTDFQGGNVTVTVPVSEELAGKKLVCVYIDDNDKYIMMDGALAADGKTFTFTTGHFSTYAILSEEEANAEIDGQDISKASVSGIANKTYTGKAVTQKLTVKAGDKALVEGTDYTVSYSKNVNVGVASVKISGKGKYEGTLTKTFKINPKGTSISKVTGQKKAVKVVWKKQLTKMKLSYVSGYQVQYSTSSKFTSGTSKYTNAKFSKGRTTKTIKNLKAGKKYYVRVRTYKTVDGTKCYSSWSKAKSVKTK